MDQIPAAAPTVTYQNGLLAIGAQNSTLSEILRDVRKLTGAVIDIPQGGGGERVVAQLGPGAPRDVLAQLLNGTSFNYVMLGSTTDPTAVATVMLTQRPSVGGEVQTIANANTGAFEPAQQPLVPGRLPGPQAFRQQPPGFPPANQPVPSVAAPVAEGDDSADDDSADDKDDESDADQAVQPTPQALVQPDANLAPEPIDPNQPNAGPKSPEQLLEMMRRGQPPGAGVPPGGPPPQQ